ncbi:HAD family hydrolase [Coprobacter tertius]|uniref:phosphoglycolate phosphatase n=1 Tax=Coprobacter tertius TaxID=2944915 RepID=A0ABT1MJR8_9BACT|nr:HAD family hydrolase [Coprobacter tertius]MCP9611481.1 HAD family hydrolase [Coprobacter tertius]
MKKPDALIFDMDGTLWDAVNTYTWCWNEAFRLSNLPNRLKREDLIGLMGTPIDKIIEAVAPEMREEDRSVFQSLIKKIEEENEPHMGGILYPYVKEGIRKLSEKYPLMLLSNCEKGGLAIFMNFTGLTSYFTDNICYGDTNLQKSGNMHILQKRNNIEYPVYIGDTDGDSQQSQIANIPFFFVRYGFGHTEKYTEAFDNFKELTEYFINIDNK